jgi:signal transduction histidine kinase
MAQEGQIGHVPSLAVLRPLGHRALGVVVVRKAYDEREMAEWTEGDALATDCQIGDSPALLAALQKIRGTLGECGVEEADMRAWPEGEAGRPHFAMGAVTEANKALDANPGSTGIPAPRSAARPAPSPADDLRRKRRQLSHDIRHELGTIMMLASLLIAAPEAAPQTRRRAEQILGETRWLEQLHRAYEEAAVGIEPTGWIGPLEAVRLDLLATEVATPLKLSTMTRITWTLSPTAAYIEPLSYWRALRNVLGNAVRAAGADGHVHLDVANQDGWAVVQIEDDGPGFGAGSPGIASLGLGIVQELVAGWGGHLEIRTGRLGGACVRMRLPVAAVAEAGPDGEAS